MSFPTGWSNAALTFLVLVLAAACRGPASPEVDEGENEGPDTYRHMLLRVTAGNPPTGQVFDVEIFDQETGASQYLGSSLPNGKFCTINTLDASKEYRVEVHELPSRRCLLWIRDVSLGKNPTWWANSCDETPTAQIHMGVPPFPTESGCLGG